MKRLFIFFILLFSSVVSAFPQMIGYLENDERIHKGVMENGFTYYLVKNSVLPGYANFTLVQKTDELSGDRDDWGMTKLMECLSLTETLNFPDGKIFTFLDNMGLNDKKDLKIRATSSDITFSWRNIPLKKNAGVCDSVLLSFYNLAAGVIFNEESLKNGKNFFANVFSATMTLPNRVTDSLQHYYFKENFNSSRNQAQMFPIVAQYSLEDVMRFYENNYRPDKQALIIAGDIDVGLMETKIKSLFQIIPRPDNDYNQTQNAALNLEKEEIFYFEDKEADCSEIAMYFPADRIAHNLKNTAVPFVFDYLTNISSYIINWRLNKDLYKLPFYVRSIKVDIVPFFNERDFRISLQCSPENYKDAYAFLAAELERLTASGVTELEFKRAEQAVKNSILYNYNNKNSADNIYVTDLCTANFIRDYSMFGIEIYKSYIDKISPSINESTIGQFIKSIFNGRICVTVCTSPEKCEGLESVKIPELPAYEDEIAVLSHPEEKSAENTRIFKSVNKSIGFVSDRLQNGALLVYKKQNIEPGWISFEATAPGGISLADKNHKILQEYINDIADISIVGGMNKYQLEEAKAASSIILKREIIEGSRKLKGKFHKEYIDEFLQFVHFYFEHCEEDSTLFEKYRSMETSLIPYKDNSPEKVFNSLRNRNILDNQYYSEENADIKSLDYKETLEFVNYLFSNVADFSFTFIGDIDENELRNSVDRYIGSLKGERRIRRENGGEAFFIAGYDNTVVKELEMEHPRYLYSCKLTVPSKLTIEDRSLSEIAAAIIRREIKRNSYMNGFLISTEHKFITYPQEVMTFEIMFPSACNIDGFDIEFSNIINSLAENGTGNAELANIKQNILLNNDLHQKTDFDYWHSIFKYRFINQKDFYTTWNDAINGVTLEKINLYLKHIAREGNITLYGIIPKE